MENLSKKVGYLRGLMEGLGLDVETPDGKLTAGMVDLLAELSERVENLDDTLDELSDYVESIDDDLADLEGQRPDEDDGFFDVEDEDFDDAFGDGEDKLHLLRPEAEAAIDEEDEDDEDDDDDDDDLELSVAGKICPECGRVFLTLYEDPEDAEYDCPFCHARVTPEPITLDNAPLVPPVAR